MFETVSNVKKLWKGEKVWFAAVDGSKIAVETYPKPVSSNLDVWISVASNPELFLQAGKIGANILTHMLGNSIEELEEKIKIYRKARKDHGHDPHSGKVTVMLHTFVHPNEQFARNVVEGPFKKYLRDSLDLISLMSRGESEIDEKTDIQFVEKQLEQAFLRYYDHNSLIGSIDKCMKMVSQLREISVDEIACLIDFGIEYDLVMEGLKHLSKIKEKSQQYQDELYTIDQMVKRYGVTFIQTTPSMLQMMLDQQLLKNNSSIRKLVIGGEALTTDLLKRLRETKINATVFNMYGPTETTIWSSIYKIKPDDPLPQTDYVPIGRPLNNTRIYIMNDNMQLLPIGVPGEIWISGEGVSQGYWKQSELTNERFVPDPYGKGLMYRTGDRAYRSEDGMLHFIGRKDNQVKLRGYRIELGEIENLSRTASGYK